MRRFTLYQDIAATPERHWQLFLDDTFDREQYLVGFRYPSYQLITHKDDGDRVRRTIRVTPRLDVPPAVGKLLGSSFAYTEEGSFDKKTQVWRSRLIPSVIADRLSSESVVRVEAAGEGRCRRICELSVDARIFAVGGLVEVALEKNLRDGWADSARYMNDKLRKEARP